MVSQCKGLVRAAIIKINAIIKSSYEFLNSERLLEDRLIFIFFSLAFTSKSSVHLEI